MDHEELDALIERYADLQFEQDRAIGAHEREPLETEAAAIKAKLHAVLTEHHQLKEAVLGKTLESMSTRESIREEFYAQLRSQLQWYQRREPLVRKVLGRGSLNQELVALQLEAWEIENPQERG